MTTQDAIFLPPRQTGAVPASIIPLRVPVLYLGGADAEVLQWPGQARQFPFSKPNRAFCESRHPCDRGHPTMSTAEHRGHGLQLSYPFVQRRLESVILGFDRLFPRA